MTNTTSQEWEKEFDREFEYNFTHPDDGALLCASPGMLKHFIRTLLASQKQELIEELLKLVGGLTIQDLYAGIEKMGKTAVHKGPLSQARYDGFNVAKGKLIDQLNNKLLS